MTDPTLQTRLGRRTVIGMQRLLAMCALICMPLLWSAALLAVDTSPPGGVSIDVNRPRSQFECDTPVGINWYGSTLRCLEEQCGGQNVTNEWIFDQSGRARKNPCYGFNPFEFKQQ